MKTRKRENERKMVVWRLDAGGWKGEILSRRTQRKLRRGDEYG